MTHVTRERVRGCLLGGAVGDALGAPVEFLRLGEIRRRHGPHGLTDLVEGDFTDDTQMTLFTAEGLIRAQQRFEGRGVRHVPSVVRYAYLRWLDTQGAARGVEGAEDALAPDRRGWLVDEPVLRRQCAPGTTCLSGLRSGRLGSRESPLNDSKGCGGVMRIAPAGLGDADPFGLACDLAALTHGHPSGYLAAGAFAVAIDAVVRGAAIRDAVAAARRAVADEPRGDEVVRAIDGAVALADAGEITPESLETLGGGWVADEALAITFACALAEPDPRRALLLSVNHSGDSDSTGSMVGQFLGAAHGIDAIPADWVERLEGRDLVERVAEDFAVRFIDGRPLDPHLYPGC
jgi:ADP-ribosylglycohydrolase